MQAGGMEQQRLRDLASYLGGQQQLGLGSQQLAQRRRESSMLGLGTLGQHARGAGALGGQRGLAPFGAGAQAAGLGLGQMTQPTYQQGTQGYVPGILGGLGGLGLIGKAVRFPVPSLFGTCIHAGSSLFQFV